MENEFIMIRLHQNMPLIIKISDKTFRAFFYPEKCVLTLLCVLILRRFASRCQQKNYLNIIKKVEKKINYQFWIQCIIYVNLNLRISKQKGLSHGVT